MYKDLVDRKGEYNTPKYLFNYLNKHFHFTLDPCSTEDNYLGTKFYMTEKDDGLNQNWYFDSIFINPPYGKDNERLWIEKAIKEHTKNGSTIFLLLPAKTEASWYNKLFCMSTVIIFPQKRIHFIHKGKKRNGNNIGSIIFGLIKRYNDINGKIPNQDTVNKLEEFFKQNDEFDIPMDIYEDKIIAFPDRKVLEKNYLSTLTCHTK